MSSKQENNDDEVGVIMIIKYYKSVSNEKNETTYQSKKIKNVQ